VIVKLPAVDDDDEMDDDDGDDVDEVARRYKAEFEEELEELEEAEGVSEDGTKHCRLDETTVVAKNNSCTHVPVSGETSKYPNAPASLA